MAAKTISVAEAARIIGKSASFVVRHAPDLGGVQVTAADLGKRKGDPSWRFFPDQLPVRLDRLRARLAKGKK